MLYVQNNQNSYAITWNKQGYGSLPSTQLPFGTDKLYDVILPPHNNIVADWGFESGLLGGEWQSTGTLPAAITDTVYHSGHRAVVLGNVRQMEQIVIPTTGERHDFWFDVDSNGVGHLVVRESLLAYDDFYYMQLGLDGSWSAPEVIDADGVPQYNQPKVIVTDNGRVHVFWQDGPPTPNQTIMYRRRDVNGTWSATEPVIGTFGSNGRFYVAISNNGTLHVLAENRVSPHGYREAFYTYRTANDWASPIQLSDQGHPEAELESAALAVGPDGRIHALWKEGGDYRVVYRERTATGSWLPIVEIIDIESPGVPYALQMVVDKRNHIHIIWQDAPKGEPSRLYYIQRNSSGQWSQAAIIDQGFTINESKLAVSESGIPHVIWDYNGPYHTWRDKNGQWHYPQSYQQNEITPGNYNGIYSPEITIDELEVAHLVWVEIPDSTTGNYEVYYAQVRPAQQLLIEKLAQGHDSISYSYLVQLVVKDFASPYVLWKVYDDVTFFISKSKQATATGISAVSQVMTIPLTMANPTLSYAYELAGAQGPSQDALTVSIDNGTDVTNLNITKETALWQHQWYDMSAWSGETVTVTFALHETANTINTWAIIDEVTLGSAYPDLWVNHTQANVFLGETVVHQITYGNRGGATAVTNLITYTLPAGLSFVSASIPPTTTTADQVLWQIDELPAKGEPFTIEVTLMVEATAVPFTTLISTIEIGTEGTELELLNNYAEGGTYIGRFIYLPFIAKN